MSTTQRYRVTGMTCGHCQAAITEEVEALAGVEHVDVDLEAATVTVTGTVDDAVIGAAITDAGYTFDGRAESA